MIPANELRIGNWVRDTEVGFKDDFKVKVGDIVSIATGRGSEFAPIPLTPEILLACGFEDLHGEACPHYRKEQLEIEIIPNGEYNARLRWDWEESGISLLLSKLSHLHQLQNLYFALTGTELEYKP